MPEARTVGATAWLRSVHRWDDGTVATVSVHRWTGYTAADIRRHRIARCREVAVECVGQAGTEPQAVPGT